MADSELSLWYHFASSKSLQPIAGLGPTLGIVRASERRVFGPTGLLETVASGVAGFDHDPITGRSLGLLVEEARTNICLQSEDFANASWLEGASMLAVVGNEAAAPDGTTTADLLIDDSGGGTGAVDISQAITLATLTTYTLSIYVKADQLDWVRLHIVLLGSLDIEAFFDLTNGAVGSSPGANNTSEFIEDVGDGFFRCGIVFLSDAVDTTCSFQIFVAEADGDSTVDLDGTSSIFAWGAQVEAGAFPTSYIKTEASSVTRNADVVSTTDVSWLNASAGTMYFRGRSNAFSNSEFRVWQLDDGTNDERIRVYALAVGRPIALGVDGGGTQFQLTADTANVVNTEYASSLAWAANDIAFISNSDPVETDSLATLPTVTQLSVGSEGVGSLGQINGHIAEIRYYNVRKDNQFLEDLSNGLISESGGAIYPIGLQSDLMFGP